LSIVLSTKSFPPEIGGSAFLLHELLRHWPKESLTVVHGVNTWNDKGSINSPFERKQVTFFKSRFATLKIQQRYPHLLINRIKRSVIKAAKRQKAKVIYLHYPNAAFVIGGYLASKALGLPYIIYFDILWEENGGVNEELLAKKYEGVIVAGASKHFAITEFAVDHLSKKHEKEFQLIPHTLDSTLLMNRKELKPSSDTFKIHLAGGVNPMMNADAIFRFYSVLNKLGVDYQMEICTSDVPEPLKSDKRISIGFYNKEELIQRQSEADLLLLPQAFEKANPIMIKNNFPTKTMEYLSSGTPILVHSPEDSYLTWLAKKEGFAMVVDTTDVKQLSSAIRQILTDNQLRTTLSNNSKKFAKSRSSKTWSKILHDQISF
jgi:glycosyltransferase involved in cell wall biosynthesis